MEKKLARLRRAKKSRFHIRELGETRLCIFKTPRHLYAQVIAEDGSRTLLAASTLDAEVKSAGGDKSNIKSAAIVGKVIAQRAIAAGIKKVAFDRSGFRYHGCVKALADAAREAGLLF